MQDVIEAELVSVVPNDQRDQWADMLALWFAGKSHHTELAYRRAVLDLGGRAGMPDEETTVAWLLSRTPQQAAAVMMRYRAGLGRDGVSPQTINMRLSAVRSLFKHARDLGLVTFTPTARWARAEKYKDTRGPGIEGVRAMLAACDGSKPTDVRNRALLWLLFGMALRAFEVCGLDFAHVDLDIRKAWVLGKRRHEREAITMPAQTVDAVARYLAQRGNEPGPLFWSRNNPRTSLSTRTLYAIIRKIGERARLPRKVTPHGLRHAACTAALDSGADQRSVQRFMRHANPATVKIYDDNRKDLAGEVAGVLGGLI